MWCMVGGLPCGVTMGDTKGGALRGWTARVAGVTPLQAFAFNQKICEPADQLLL